MTSLILFVTCLGLMAVGMPVAFAIGIAGFTYFMLPGTYVPAAIGVQQVVSTTQSFPLLAVPLFILIGHLMNASGIMTRLVRLSDALAGWMIGGLAQASIVLSTLMGGVSGSAVADAAMQGRIISPGMVKHGYSKGFTGSVIAIGSLITATIPPSIGLILYGFLGEVSIGKLFVGGIVPGALLMIALMLATRFFAKRRGYRPSRETRPSFAEVLSEVRSSIWALLFPVWLLVGIRFGLFTPSEAGAFAVAYALVVGLFIYRELTFRRIVEAFRDAVVDIGMVMLLIMFSGIIGYVISLNQVPQSLAMIVSHTFHDKYLLLFALSALLIVLGMIVEATVVVMLLTPILVPVVEAAGIDPVHFGLIMVTLVTFGGMTPPVGVAMYAVCGVMNCSIQEYTREMLPFAVAVMVVVVLMIFFPQLVLFLPNHF
ncbi:TRAP transporter large permease [Salinisphaera sp. SWV1]|uniref:TRAP transporter large permease n=1 Tax=Salinisphaera sp. SWV1 TaxID=3454139 RepID=UPI003F835D86